jgi:serine/threonine-protein kinase
MATVYAAYDESDGGLYALKVPHPGVVEGEDGMRMILDEARQAEGARGPLVVRMHGLTGDGAGSVALVMDYVDGLSLAELRNRAFDARLRISAPVLFRIVLDVLEALDAAHRAVDDSGRPLGIVHRDVTPSNLLVGSDGRTRLIDFGVAASRARHTRTRPGRLKGKAGYFAPETVARGRSDLRADIYQLGVVLWEGLALRSLFPGGYGALGRILKDRIPPISEIRPELALLDPILERALARDPAARYRCAEVFAQDLRRAAAFLGGVAEPARVARMLETLGGDSLTGRRTRLAAAIDALNRPESKKLEPTRSGIRTRPRRPTSTISLELPAFEESIGASDLFPAPGGDGPTHVDGMPPAVRKLWLRRALQVATAAAGVALAAALLLS